MRFSKLRATLLALSSLALATGLTACADPAGETQQAATPVEPMASPELLEEHIVWLSDDARQGREAGTEGYDAAAEYVAGQYEALGLTPMGDDGSWFQQVPLRGVRRDLEAQAFTIERDGETVTLSAMEDYLMGASAARKQADVTAEAVFVGYGVDAPELGIESFAGVDVEGKIVVALGGMPTGLPSESAAHYAATKFEMADARGAVGYITVPTEAYEQRYPFSRSVARAGGTGVTWVGKDGTGFSEAPGLVATARLSAPGAEKLFEGTGISYGDLRAMAAEEGAMPESFALPGTMTLEAGSIHEDLMSTNVIGMIEGSDPALADEYVVLTAHLDHVGVVDDAEPGEDNINNGALDNASGVAVMLEEARLFMQASEDGNPPRRSVMFIALTAEEKGLIGSEYFAYNPTVPMEDIVANVNLDMPLIMYDFVDVIAFGADHSSLGQTVEEAAATMDVALIPDPIPNLNIFTRSDHYRFVQQGVPSVFVFLGFGNGGEETFENFMSNNYHQPGDDISQPLDYEAGAKFATLNYRVARSVADADERPTWNEGDFFGDLYGSDR